MHVQCGVFSCILFFDTMGGVGCQAPLVPGLFQASILEVGCHSPISRGSSPNPGGSDLSLYVSCIGRLVLNTSVT